MTWQEYQEATARLYEQAEGLGAVRRNVYLPDRTTGRGRQVDVLVEIEAKGHVLRLLIDAKYRKGRLDVKDIEEVLALAAAVGASKAVVVAANGWTKPAELKAEASNMDLRVLSLDQALDLVVADKWELCPGCEGDCIIGDNHGVLAFDDGTLLWWLGGQCRRCRLASIWCQECGESWYIGVGQTTQCDCGHEWSCDVEGMRIRPSGTSRVVPI